jgi:hypothetical protein
MIAFRSMLEKTCKHRWSFQEREMNLYKTITTYQNGVSNGSSKDEEQAVSKQ